MKIVSQQIVSAIKNVNLDKEQQEQIVSKVIGLIQGKLNGNNLYHLAIQGEELPQDLEIEEYFIGNLLYLQDKHQRIDYFNQVDLDFFFNSKFRFIFDAMIALESRDTSISPQSVCVQLKECGYYNPIKNELGYSVEEYISALREMGRYEKCRPDVMAEIIEKLALLRDKRKICDIGYKLIEDARKLDNDSISSYKEEIVKEISQTASLSGDNKEAFDGVKMADELRKQMQATMLSANGITGKPTAIIELTSITSGWRPNNLVYIGGRPSHGKTAFMLADAWKAALAGEKIVFFSLEMSASEMACRLFCFHTGVGNNVFNDKKQLEIYSKQFSDFLALMEQMKDKFILYETTGISATYISKMTTYENRKGDLSRVYVDYVQLLNPIDKSTIGKEQIVSGNSAMLKQIAMREKVIMIAGAQLSRDREKQNLSTGKGGKPQLVDLRDSGGLEQDADKVVFVWRPELSGMEEDEFGSTEGIGLLIVRKNRGGRLGEARCHFDGPTTAWRELPNDTYSMSSNNNFDNIDPFSQL